MLKGLWFTLKECLGWFTMLLFEGPSETELYLTTDIVVRNIQNMSAMRVIFFFENVQSFIYISKRQKKIEKKFWRFEAMASELATLNCLY